MRSISINIGERGAVSIVTVSGEFTINHELGKFRDVVKGLLEKGRTQLVMDLQNVNRVDSMGLGDLVRTVSEVRKRGGRMVFVSPGPAARTVIKNARLDQLFSFYDSVEAALEGLNTGPAPLST
jgi:anti-sigma B factor antagonist